MPIQFDLAEELAAGMRSAEAAFRFISRYCAAWTTPLSARDAYTPAEVQEAERRLGITFPAALREALQLFSRRYVGLLDQDRSLMHRLKGVEAFSIYADTRALMYQAENQGVWERYVRLEDMHLDDPPTFQTHWADYSRLLPFTDRLSVALMDLVLREHWWHDERLIVHGELREEQIAELAGRFEELALSSAVPCYDWIVPMAPDRWFLAPDVLVHLEHTMVLTEEESEKDPWPRRRPGTAAKITFRGRTAESLHALVPTLPEQWLT
ncbi:SMI1/KNR4 family protein [Actinomadura sp. K4S16]|uniref:SMI1/KNR4 family protein n=1 Tax=Actinomadura sp. K4S16 TaxID=1316147 RepID=UPI0011ECA2BA|nr:SMI1/KNR4 family protein [Actinomadura sp. K4S16]